MTARTLLLPLNPVFFNLLTCPPPPPNPPRFTYVQKNRVEKKGDKWGWYVTRKKERWGPTSGIMLIALIISAILLQFTRKILNPKKTLISTKAHPAIALRTDKMTNGYSIFFIILKTEPLLPHSNNHAIPYQKSNHVQL